MANTESADKIFYDKLEKHDAEKHLKWMKEIEFYFLSYADLLKSKRATDWQVAELGAGSCGLSLCLSRLGFIKKIYAVDISAARTRHLLQASFETVGGELSKIEPVQADFNESLPFQDQSLDAIFFDASLHHCRNIWRALEECHRVLKPNGILIAQRESYLSPLRSRKQIHSLLQTPEVAAKVSENMYLLDQYMYYLRVCGFDPTFIKRTPGKLKSSLSILNGGFLFTDGVIVSNKR